jgi:hypothetical protein
LRLSHRAPAAADLLTKTQSRQPREIGRRIIHATGPGDHHSDNQPPPAATPAQAP